MQTKNIIELIKFLEKKNINKIILTGKDDPFSLIELLKKQILINAKKENKFITFSNLNENLNENNNYEYSLFNYFEVENKEKINEIYFNFNFNYEKSFKSSTIIEFIKNKKNFIGFIDNTYIKEISDKIEPDIEIYNSDILIEENFNLEYILKLFPKELHNHIYLILNKENSIYLNRLCKLMKYAPLVKRDNWINFIEELKKEIPFQSYNIFDLTTFLFSKNILFFETFKNIYNNYTPEFWIPYFLDQIWLSYLYLLEIKKNGKIENTFFYKKLSRWFINGGYKKYKIEELKNLFEEIYKQDQNIKKYSLNNFSIIEGIFINFFN